MQNQLLESVAAKERHNQAMPASEAPGFDPNDPHGQLQPTQNQIMERKVSIYEILK